MTEEHRPDLPEIAEYFTFKVTKNGSFLLSRIDEDEGERVAMSTGLLKEGKPAKLLDVFQVFLAMLQSAGFDDEDHVCILISGAQVKQALKMTVELAAAAERERKEASINRPSVEYSFRLRGQKLIVDADVYNEESYGYKELTFLIDIFTPQGSLKDMAVIAREIEIELMDRGVKNPAKVSTMELAAALAARWLGKDSSGDVDDTHHD